MLDVLEFETLRKIRGESTMTKLDQAAARRQELDADAARDTLPELCFKLLQIAQRHIPAGPTGVRDRLDTLESIRTLRALGYRPDVLPQYQADLGTNSKAIVTTSPVYRSLYNKTVAALATIADITDKNLIPGSKEFQSGVREGYRRASDIAIMFLDDIQQEAGT